MTKLDIELTKNKKIVIKNEAIMGKQSMDLREAKLIRLLIMQINKRDTELMEYEADITEIAKFLNIDSSNLYRDIRSVCDSLTTRRLGIKMEDPKQPWKFYPWLSMAEYDGKGTIKIGLNEKIKSYVLELNELFTQYEMIDILAINSFYAIRIYEVIKKDYTSCRKYKNKFEYSIQELRELTDTEKKYSTIGAFKQNIIEIAEREINEKTDLLIKIEPIKKSRKYIGFRFIVNEKSKMKSIESVEMAVVKDKEQQIPGQIDYADALKILDLLADRNIPCTMDQAQQLLAAYDGQINGCFIDNLDYVAKNNRIKNRVAYLIKISNDHVAHEPDRPDQGTHQRKKNKNRIETIEPMSEARKQAYLDLEVEYTEDLWPDLPVDEELEEETESNLEEEYRNAAKKLNEMLKNPEISSRIGVSSINENMNEIEIDDMKDEMEKMVKIITALKKELNKDG